MNSKKNERKTLSEFDKMNEISNPWRVFLRLLGPLNAWEGVGDILTFEGNGSARSNEIDCPIG